MKKYLKSIFTGAMVLTMTAALAGCGGGTSAEENEEAVAAEEGGEKDTLVMATSAAFPPYEYYEGQEIVGIDAEVAQAIADKLGYQLEIEDMSFESIIPSVVSGKADIAMAGMTVNEERKKSVDFTDSYAKGVQVVLVKEGSALTDVAQLFEEGANHTVGVQTATTGDIFTTGDIEGKGLGKVERYTKYGDAINALLTDKVDCIVMDSAAAKAYEEKNEGLHILDTEYANEDYAIGLAKDSELTEKVNAALKELMEDGTVQSIVDKYITAE